MDLKGKKVLVTGGAVRIGRALCRAFADAAADIVVHCNSSLSDAETLIDELNSRGGIHSIVQADLSCRDSYRDLLKKTGHIDILVNNASIFEVKKLAEESAEEATRQFEINFSAPLDLMKQFAVQADIKQGCIINILDQRITSIDPDGGSYPLSKKALADATLEAAVQFAPAIRVNGIAPGPILPPAGYKGKGFEKVLTGVPLKRPVNLDDLTDACLLLARNESITGQIIFVDCGQHLSGSI